MTEPSRIFARHAFKYHNFGLSVIPVAGDDGKKPCVRGFQKSKHRQTVSQITQWSKQFSDSNIAILTGAVSSVTILDVDDPSQIPDLVKLAGDTPLKVRTPSGGVHLYFQFNGEQNSNLRKRGFNADIKSQGGFVVATPSVRPDGKTYEFECGDYSVISSLPVMKPLFKLNDETLPIKGERNDWLFRFLLREAHHVDDMQTLIDVAETANDSFVAPLPKPEVLATAKSAWGYHERGENWSRSHKRIIVPATVVDRILHEENGDDAILLDIVLRRHHKVGDEIAIAPRAMAKAKTLPWGENKIRHARDVLEKFGLLTRLHEGGRGTNDPSRYRLEAYN